MQADGPGLDPPGGARANRFEKRPCATTALLVALLLVILFTLDVAVTAMLGTGGRDEQAPWNTVRVRSPLYHHDLRADAEQADYYGRLQSRLYTNSLGFKDHSRRRVELVPSGRRVVLIGDSFVEGVGIDFADTLAGHLAARLAPSGVEVLNAAVSSYSPIIYYAKTRYLLEQVGLRFDELVVFIDISDIEDELSYRFDQHGRVVAPLERSGGTPRPPSDSLPLRQRAKIWLRDHTRATYAVLHGLRSLLLGPYALDQRRAAWTYDEAMFESVGREGLRRAAQHLELLRQTLARYGVSLCVVVYPWPDQILRREQDSRQVRYWADWARRHDARFVNLFPAFIDGREPRQILSRYFIRGDMHWNLRGHAFVADAFLAARPDLATAASHGNGEINGEQAMGR